MKKSWETTDDPQKNPLAKPENILTRRLPRGGSGRGATRGWNPRRRVKGRTWKSVSNSGDLDGSEVYYYTGHQVMHAEPNQAQGLKRHLDEAVLEILEDGLVWVHQGERSERERPATGKADREVRVRGATCPEGPSAKRATGGGDSLVTLAEVDSNTNGSLGAGDACWGSGPSGACRVLDFDFDDDVDAGDKTVFDALVSADTYRRPGRTTSALGHTRAHQGLILDAEIGSFNNRARQYAPQLKRFMQMDPLMRGRCAGGGYQDGGNVYTYARSSPLARRDPTGRATVIDRSTYLLWLKEDPHLGCCCTLDIRPGVSVCKIDPCPNTTPSYEFGYRCGVPCEVQSY